MVIVIVIVINLVASGSLLVDAGHFVPKFFQCFIPTLTLSGYFVHINTANSNCNDDDYVLISIYSVLI